MAGGLGYMMGNNASQQVLYQPYSSPYQGTPAQSQVQTSNADNGRLYQLQLLGELHEKGLLTDLERLAESLS
jgi:hypothetical protein